MTAETIVSIPDPVQRCLESAGLNHRPMRLSTYTDISLAGSPMRQWLIATDDHISIVGETDGSAATRYFAWPEITGIRTVMGVGSGLLQARVNEEWIDLLRYSNTFAHRFHKVAHQLDLWAKEEHRYEDASPLDQLDPPKCPTCDLRLATRDDSCPRCLPRRQILQRAWEIMSPYWRGSLGLCVLTIVGVTAELIPPKLQQYMVDHLLTQPDGGSAAMLDMRNALLVVVLALAISRFALSLVGAIKGQLATAIGSGLTCRLRKEMVSKLQRLSGRLL